MSAPELREVGIVNVTFGKNVTVIQPTNLYGCSVGDDVAVGPFVEIQKNVKVGARTKIQSHAFICELVEIGEDCFIGHGVMFTNDTFTNGGPARGDKSLWSATRVGDRVSIGSNVTLLPVQICDDVVIGAGAVVTRDIKVSGTYAGNPARLLRPSDSVILPPVGHG